MEYKTDVVLDIRGNAIFNASVRVLTVSKEIATIYDANGNQVDNPLGTDLTGQFSVAVPNGKYFYEISINGKIYETRGPISFFDAMDDGASSIYYGNQSISEAFDDRPTISDLANPSASNALGYMPLGTSSESSTVKIALDRLIKPRVDGTVQRRMVIAGSSTAAGTGATGGNGWAQQLGAVMISRGWVVSQKSIGGDNSQTLLNRFHRDVVLQAPDVCVIALVLGNEALQLENTIAGKEAKYKTYLANLQKMVWLCRQYGILPVIADSLPNNGFNADDYKFLRSVHRWIDGQPVITFSWLDALEDGAGQGYWRSIFYNDGAHTNDAGHDLIFNAINPSIFECIVDSNLRLPVPQRKAGWRNTDTAGNIPLRATFEFPMRSYTVAFRCTTASLSRGVWGVNNTANGNGTRLSTNGPGGVFQLNPGSGTTIDSAIPVDGREHHFAIRYDHYAQQLSLFIDAMLIGSITFQQNEKIQWMSFMDRAAGGTPIIGTMNDILVYRTALNDASIKSIFDGDIPKGSLDLYCPLGDPDVLLYSRAENYVPTSSYLAITGTGIVVDTNGASAKLQGMNVVRESSADPTSTEIPRGTWSIWRNTTSGVVRVWTNVGGVLRSVTLT